MKRKATRTLVLFAIEAAILAPVLYLLLPALHLQHDSYLLACFVSGLVVGWPAGPVLAYIWFD